MAKIPNNMTVTVTNGELAAELEAIAEQHEEFANLCRMQAEHLRAGFELHLSLQATQVMHKPEDPDLIADSTPAPESEVMEGVCGDIIVPNSEELDGDISDEEVAKIFPNPERPRVGLQPLEPSDPEVLAQWRKGSHLLPWGNYITVCGIDTKGLRMSWDEKKGDWVHPEHPDTMKAQTTARLKYVDCPDCRDHIRSTFVNPEKSDIEWLMDPQSRGRE